jgi:gluconate 2-dehydrogenase gamma chain
MESMPHPTGACSGFIPIRPGYRDLSARHVSPLLRASYQSEGCRGILVNMCSAPKRNNGADSISRRAFLNRLTVLSALAAVYPVSALAAVRQRASAAPDADEWSSSDPWKTLNAVQQHLFPGTDDAPGAFDIGALPYLRTAIESPGADGEDRTFLFNGVGWLNESTQETYRRAFVRLDEEQREDALRRIEQSRAGRNWLSLLLTYLLEALLADPVYGGNPGGIGWQWLEHRPGYPTPPADKVWYRIGERVSFHRKAT